MAVADRVRLIEALVAAGGATHRGGGVRVADAPCPPWPGRPRCSRRCRASAGVRYSALVPNVRGAELALESDVDELTVTDLAVRDLQPAQRPHVDGRVGGGHRGDLPRSPRRSRSTRCSAAASARRTRARSRRPRSPRWPTGCAAAAAPPSPAPTPPGWPPPGASPRCSRRWAPTSGCTSTRPAAPRSCAPTPPCSSGSPGSTPRSAGSAAHRSRAGAAGNLATEELVAVLDDLGVHTGIDVESLVVAAPAGR